MRPHVITSRRPLDPMEACLLRREACTSGRLRPANGGSPHQLPAKHPPYCEQVGGDEQEASHGLMDPFNDTGGGVRFAARFPALRSPRFASPGTFPSQRFSRSQGFTPPHTLAALFHAAAIRRVSGTEADRTCRTGSATHSCGKSL